MKPQTLTCEYAHDVYGTLVLRGQYQPFEADTGTPESAILESALTYDGEELYTWHNWVDSNGVKRNTCAHFSGREILAMESALLHRGEFSGRVAPSQEMLARIRLMLGLAPVVVVDNDVFIIDAVKAA